MPLVPAVGNADMGGGVPKMRGTFKGVYGDIYVYMGIYRV